VRVLLSILAVILFLPVLLLVGVALGPAALVLLFIAGLALLVLLVQRGLERLFHIGR
jgi:hypothetical protein